MSIQKACRLKHEKRPYTMLFNKALQECDDLEMIGLWSHFSTLPEDWAIHVSYICTRFRIGRDKAYSLLRKMESHGLLKYVQNRDKNGRFIGTDVIILDGANFTKEPVNKLNNKPFPKNQEAEPPFPEKPDTVKPDPENRTHTKETLLTKEKKEQKLFENFKAQKQETHFADVSTRSNSFNAPLRETPEESERKSLEYMNDIAEKRRMTG